MNKFKLKKIYCSSIYQCITPIFYLSKIFGLAPFNSPSKNTIFKTSFLDYSIFLLMESCCLYLLYYILFSKFIVSVPLTILHICGVASILWIIFVTSVSVTLAMFQRKTFYHIFMLVNECDEKVFELVLINFKFLIFSISVNFTGCTNKFEWTI